MDKSVSAVILIVFVVVLLAGGFFSGMLFQKMAAAPQLEKLNNTISQLGSDIVPSIIAFGQVSDVKGRDVTITYNDSSLKAHIADNAPVYSFAMSGGSSPTQQEAKFGDIKNGDNLNISIKLLPDGSFEGSSVIILSSAK